MGKKYSVFVSVVVAAVHCWIAKDEMCTLWGNHKLFRKYAYFITQEKISFTHYVFDLVHTRLPNVGTIYGNKQSK